MTYQQRLEPGKYLLDVEAFMLLADSGAFGDAGTELIAGDVFIMSPEYAPHFRIKSELAYRLRRALEAEGSELFVGTEGSVRVSSHDMPQPDILVTSAVHGDGPLPITSLVLIVEVSASTLPYDLGGKASLYAGANVPEYWVVDVQGRAIKQMWSPMEGAYEHARTTAFGSDVTAVTIGGLTVSTAGL